MDAKEKLQFFNEITDEFLLVSKRGFSNAKIHLNDELIGKIMKEYEHFDNLLIAYTHHLYHLLL